MTNSHPDLTRRSRESSPLVETGGSRGDALSTSELISLLNGLIETCRDGAEGFANAAADIHDADYRVLFGRYAEQRKQYERDFHRIVENLGGTPVERGTFLASLHRGWTDLRAVAAGGRGAREEHTILAECERGEDAAKKNYWEAVKKNLPADIRAVVEAQYGGVKEAHDRLRVLRGPA